MHPGGSACERTDPWLESVSAARAAAPLQPPHVAAWLWPRGRAAGASRHPFLPVREGWCQELVHMSGQQCVSDCPRQHLSPGALLAIATLSSPQNVVLADLPSWKVVYR